MPAKAANTANTAKAAKSAGAAKAAKSAETPVLDFFVREFASVFYDRLVGARRLDPGIHVLFTGPCGLTTQLAAETHVARFAGFVARYWDYESFQDLAADVSRVSIDKSVRMVVVPEVARVPVSHLKRLCAIPNAWVVASGGFGPATPALFQVETVAPRPATAAAVIREECARAGIATADPVPADCDYDTAGEFVAACDGFAGPAVALRAPADTAHRLIASGAPTSYICKMVFKHAIAGAKCKRAVTRAAALCDAEMARCRRSLVLAKILEFHLAQIARYSESE